MNDLFKSLVFDVLVKAAIQRLFILVPLLGWGPIGYIVSFYLTKFADLGYQSAKEELTFGLIKFQNAAHQAAFDKEFVKLSLMQNAYQNFSEKEIKDEIKMAQDRMAEFVVHNRA